MCVFNQDSQREINIYEEETYKERSMITSWVKRTSNMPSRGSRIVNFISSVIEIGER